MIVKKKKRVNIYFSVNLIQNFLPLLDKR